jgi:nitrous oxide reductase accessory protein NosL
MLKVPLIIMLLILLLSSALAGVMDAVEAPITCKKCGMDRNAYAHSRMLIVYADGTNVGVCSLHCAAAVLQDNNARQIATLKVADYATKVLLDAGTAVWVVGGKKMGVMTVLPKWAFASAEGAHKFVEESGGDVSSFEQAMKSAVREVSEQAAEDFAAESYLHNELK